MDGVTLADIGFPAVACAYRQQSLFQSECFSAQVGDAFDHEEPCGFCTICNLTVCDPCKRNCIECRALMCRSCHERLEGYCEGLMSAVSFIFTCSNVAHSRCCLCHAAICSGHGRCCVSCRSFVCVNHTSRCLICSRAVCSSCLYCFKTCVTCAETMRQAYGSVPMPL